MFSDITSVKSISTDDLDNETTFNILMKDNCIESATTTATTLNNVFISRVAVFLKLPNPLLN